MQDSTSTSHDHPIAGQRGIGEAAAAAHEGWAAARLPEAHGQRSHEAPAGSPRERVAAALGLSHRHIWPRPQSAGPAGGEISVAQGGQFVKLRGYGGRPGDSSSVRGAIHGFSKRSQQRMGEVIWSVDRKACVHLPAFVTLTYPRIFTADPQRWKRDLQAFIKRLLRLVQVQGVVWKLEPQERGAPHFHLMVFISAKISRFWVSETWHEIAYQGPGGKPKQDHLKAGTKTETLRSWHGVTSYASKRYMAKTVEQLPSWWRKPGRFWGIRGDLPHRVETFELDRAETCRVRRVLRRYLARKLGRRVRTHAAAGLAVRLHDHTGNALVAWVIGLPPPEQFLRQ